MSSKIKITLCTDGVFPHAMGGMQRHSSLLAMHLAQREDVELTVLHPHTVPLFDAKLGIKEVHVPPIDPEKLYLRELWRYSAAVAQVLDRVGGDVIMSQGFCVWKDVDRFKGRLIVHPHGLEMFQGLTVKDKLIGLPFRMLLRYLVARSRVTISLGGKLTGILNKLAKGTTGKIAVLPNAVEVPSVQVIQDRNATLRILFVGRFAFNKGIDVLMSVAERLVAEGHGGRLQFELAGSGSLLEHFKSKGLPSNVQLLGRVEDDELFALYTQCDAFLLPTRFEGMPTVVLEAMARSMPIIVSDVGATAELVGRDNGWLLPPGDADALYRALIEFMELTQSERAILGARSLARVQADFTWPKVTERTVELFRNIVSTQS
ncbi:MAG: glycosyltransferase family 4 protein [Flavobacteriales bacterium]|nr:glycosyltransferase family 4 protein [Flavobacteriales bacterium]MBK6946115.1 glycosyltransferase family 4 protein [Flavobacteriales bacterium]MBK9536946.1 glycosyltransferase family 4 protein [Flavobacteriales bacterium]MBP9139435.1 glycosyltransferase family 4 protein [Flavobacteriales bacterium]HQV53749.1 glycosyltransferase family 4 protein [Flavobacteriales bacterium]